jgi:membrane associated rhomboid family serine protease
LTSVVRTILLATVGAFFLQQTLPYVANLLVFVPAYVLVRPWTVLTYMLLHGGLTHILFNMLGLFFFGPRIEERIGSRPFLALYLVSGASGALLSLALALAGIGPSAPIIGASAGVFGVMLAFAWFYPDEPIYIWGVLPIPARILVLITTVITLWSGLSGRGGGVAHFAHLGGYVGAFLFLKILIARSTRTRQQFQRRMTAVPPDTARRLASYQAIDRTRIHELNREEVDRILDKISARGLGSLTPQEQLFLSNFVPPDDRKPVS